MQHQRQQIVTFTRQLDALGLNQGRTGNLSLRLDDGFLITPTGISSDELDADQIVYMRMDGSVPADQYKPSSEWRFHRDIYAQRQDIAAIIHSHSTYATVLACHRKSIPAFHYMVAEAGGNDIRCADYATFGSQALSDNVIKAMRHRKACLLANHGMIAGGADLTVTLRLARLVEELAKQYVLAVQIGEPVILPQQEMAIILDKFKDYGKQHDAD